MLRFKVRDIFWFSVVGAAAVCSCADRIALKNAKHELERDKKKWIEYTRRHDSEMSALELALIEARSKCSATDYSSESQVEAGKSVGKPIPEIRRSNRVELEILPHTGD